MSNFNGQEATVIGIRADGNEILGMGHLMRCMSIAKALEDKGAVCIFFVADETAGNFLKDRGFKCHILNTDFHDMESEIPILKKTLLNENLSPRLWLADSYQLTENYMSELKKTGPVLYLDDTGEGIFKADGIINYNIYADSLSYEKKCQSGMKLLLGAKYAPVKEAFLKTPYQVRKCAENVLITMGGSDRLNIAGSLCQRLLEKLPANMEITLICGRFNPHLQKLLFLEKKNERVHVQVDVTDMWNVMSQTDIAISSAGSTMYELSALGVPSVCCYYVENQRRIAEDFAKKVGICNAGDFSKNPEDVLEKITDEVCRLADNMKAREELSERMKKVTDGRGAERIAREILSVCR